METITNLDEVLSKEHLLENPIKSIMEFNKGYYFLPAFYALCQHLQKDSRWMVDQLYTLLDTEFHPLLKKLGSLNPKIIQDVSAHMTVNTIHYCIQQLVACIEETYRRQLLSLTTFDQVFHLVSEIQERHLPVRMFKNALKKPTRQIWNDESWQEVKSSSQVTKLWTCIKQHYIESGGGPNEELIQRCSGIVPPSRVMEMDTQKWLLRLQDGVLDLLTGHVGGTVPEFYLSDRKLNISRMHNVEAHEILYDLLTGKEFFLKYLHDLMQDKTDNLFDTLKALVPEATDDISQSMMHFYVNLCKWTSFNYELLMYMLDVLASVYVGTNYEQKFFVLRGQCYNGRTHLFQLMERVLGGYYHYIYSDDFKPTTEFVSTLFSCRMGMITLGSRDFNEDMINKMTSNSAVQYGFGSSGSIPTAKIFGDTNIYFKPCDRTICIEFKSKFVIHDVPAKTSIQVEMNRYGREKDVIKQSFKGCFLTLYYHLKKNMSLEDGLLHYRENPELLKNDSH